MLRGAVLLRTMSAKQRQNERYIRMRKRPEVPPAISTLSRRTMLAAMPLLLAACSRQGFDVLSDGNYGTVNDDNNTVPAVDSFDPGLMREEVAWRGSEKPGS